MSDAKDIESPSGRYSRELGGEAELQTVARGDLRLGFSVCFKLGETLLMFVYRGERVSGEFRWGVSGNAEVLSDGCIFQSWKGMRIHRAPGGISFWIKGAGWVIKTGS